MIDLFKKLIESLDQETEHYLNLASLVEQQKDILVTGKIEVLPSNVYLEEKEVFALSPIISRRNEILTQIAKFLNVQNMTLTDALKYAPVECIEELKKAVIELVRSAKQLEEMNKSNEKLLNNAISYVKFTLAIIANGGKKKVSSSLTSEEKNSSFVNRVV